MTPTIVIRRRWKLAPVLVSVGISNTPDPQTKEQFAKEAVKDAFQSRSIRAWIKTMKG